MSSSGALEEMVAKIIKSGALLFAPNQISPWGGLWNENVGSFEISFKYFRTVWWEVLGLKREENLSFYCCVALEKSHLLSELRFMISNMWGLDQAGFGKVWCTQEIAEKKYFNISMGSTKVRTQLMSFPLHGSMSSMEPWI